MKTKRKFFKALALTLVLCLCLGCIVHAVPIEEDVQPYSMYFSASSSNFTRLSGKVNLIVTTEATRYVSSIYHDVEIYKNGELYLSQRYSDTNCVDLVTSIDIPASSGDYFIASVTHYTHHNGYLESDESMDAVNY